MASCLEQPRDLRRTRARRRVARLQIAAAVDFDLQRMDAARRRAVALDHVRRRQTVVDAGAEAHRRGRSSPLRRVTQGAALWP